MVMPRLTVGELEIPFDVTTLEGFRAWARTLGEHGPRVAFYDGDVFVEMMQSYRSHGPVVSAVNRRLAALAAELQLGVYFDPPSWITCAEANLSTEPDGFLVRYERLRRGEVRVNPELEVELQGRPDFVFEALSATSQRKDLVRLVEGYARALVPEYWIADLRALRVSGLQVEGPCELRVLVLDEQGTYVAQEADDDGWTASPTWSRALRLRPFVNPGGLLDVDVEVRLP